MDTHVVNAVLAGTKTKSSLIESISCSSQIIPDELDVEDNSTTALDWVKLQRNDPNLSVIIKLIESDQLFKRKLHRKDSSEVKALLRNRKSLKLFKDILYRKSYTDNSSSRKVLWQLVVPKAYRARALAGCHDDVGHQGRMRTISLLRERFFWPGMQEEATQYVVKSSRCLRRKTTPQVAPLQPIYVTQPLELVHMDCLSLEPSKGNIENVLVITDHFTRYALAYPSKTQTAQATARILWDNFICHYGFPEKFISDQGRNFESDLIKELCKIAAVKKLHTTPYHPQGNGQCERFNSTLCNMLGTLSEEEKSDWKSYPGCMTHAYNCTKHASTTYSPYFLMFGRHPRLPIDVEFGLPKHNCGDYSSKSRYVQKLRRRLNYAYKKASKYSDQQAQKYKSSYDKSIKGPQLQEKDIVLVKVVAHKGRHKLQDKWEPEEYVVIEQPIAGTPVYKVQPVNGGNIRTLHRNLLLPLGVKLEPDYKSDDSILDEDSDDDSVELTDSKTQLYGKRKSKEDSSKGKSQFEIVEEKPELKSRKEKHVEFESQPDIFSDICFESDTVIAPGSKLEKSEIAVTSDNVSNNVSTESTSHPSLEESSDKVIPEDISLPSQFLLPTLDDSSSEEETGITELKTEAELHDDDNEEEMPLVDSEASSLVNTNELLEFIDTIDMGKPDSIKQSEITVNSEQSSTLEHPMEQTSVDPKSESQFSSFMSYHEGESSSLDPSTMEQELSKSPIEGSTQKYDSGATDQVDISSHDEGIIAYETKESSSPSVEISSSTTSVTENEKVAEVNELESTIEVEVMEPRRSGRDRKQTKFFGNPLLYRVTYHLTPRFVPELLQHLSETMETLQNKYSDTVEF